MEWTSDARDSYNISKAKWDAAAAQMVVQAGNAENALTQINDAYANAEYQASDSGGVDGRDEDLPWDGGTTTIRRRPDPPPGRRIWWRLGTGQRVRRRFHRPAGPHGHTKVDTASLDLFRRNIEQLIQPVKDALAELRDSPSVQPGPSTTPT